MRTFLILISVGILSIAGCGGDKDTTATGAGNGQPDTSTATDGSSGAQPSTTAPSDSTAGSTSSGATTGGREYKPASPTDRDEASTVVHAYYLALAGNDAKRACSLVTTAARKEIAEQLSQSPKLKGQGCASVIRQLTKGYPDAFRANLKRLKVVKVLVKGDVAFTRYQIPGEPLSLMPMKRDGGKWRVTALAGVPSDQVPIP